MAPETVEQIINGVARGLEGSWVNEGNGVFSQIDINHDSRFVVTLQFFPLRTQPVSVKVERYGLFSGSLLANGEINLPGSLKPAIYISRVYGIIWAIKGFLVVP